jgi:hypothetical protein
LIVTLQIIDDDEDFDEDNIPGFSHPTIPQSPQADKGKTRAREPEQLAPPSGNIQSGSQTLSGNIGSSSSAQRTPSRQTVGGLQVETRFVSVYSARLFVAQTNPDTLVLIRWTNR